MTDRARRRLTALLVGVLAALCFLPGIGRVPLFDRDETRFSEAAREMLVGGDYVVPYFNGEYRLHKPILIYWVMAGTYKAFGVNEFAARLGSALAGVATCVLVFYLARSIFGLAPAALAGVVTATNLMELVEARAATVDSLQLLFVVVCFMQLWRIYQGARRWDAYVLLYGAIALGTLTKGPVVVGVVLLAVAGIALMDRSLALVKRLHLIVGLIASTIPPAIWFFMANHATHGAVVTELIGHQMIGPAIGDTFEGHGGLFVYYLVLLPATFFPWTATLPLGVWRTWAAPEGRKARTFLVAWAVAPFIMFSFLKTKLPHYTLPGYPALAIMVGFGLEEAVRQRRAILGHWTGKLGFGLFALVCLGAAAAFCTYPFIFGLQSHARGFLALAILVVAMAAFALNDLLRRRNGLVAVDLAAGTTILVLAIWLGLLPAIAGMMAPGRMKVGLAKVLRPDDQVLSLKYSEPSTVFYAGRHVTFVRDWQAVESRLSTTRQFVCIAPSDRLDAMPPELRHELEVVGQVSAFRLGTGKWTSFSFLRPRPVGDAPAGVALRRPGAMVPP
jgi:4-amino-4-deoxy-L-arabinose transferase-like glycosyltransferase